MFQHLGPALYLRFNGLRMGVVLQHFAELLHDYLRITCGNFLPYNTSQRFPVRESPDIKRALLAQAADCPVDAVEKDQSSVTMNDDSGPERVNMRQMLRGVVIHCDQLGDRWFGKSGGFSSIGHNPLCFVHIEDIAVRTFP